MLGRNIGRMELKSLSHQVRGDKVMRACRTIRGVIFVEGIWRHSLPILAWQVMFFILPYLLDYNNNY